jgi:ribosomal protein S18 acetylase RimI-like enzyme
MTTISETNDADLISVLNEEVQTLHHMLYPERFKPYNKNEVRPVFKDMLGQQNCKAYVAYDDGAPAGYIIFFIKEVNDNPFHYQSTSVYIDQLAVLKKHRQKGIGKLLLETAEKQAAELSIADIELDYWNENNEAALFFERHGFKTVRHIARRT